MKTIDIDFNVYLKVIWTVLFAFLIQKEYPSIGTIFCCLLVGGGTMVVSLDFAKKVFDSRVTVCQIDFPAQNEKRI